MKKIISLVLVFLLAFSVFVAITMPASIVLQLSQGSLPRALSVGAVSGSIWEGRISEVRYENVQLNDVTWQLNGWGLLTGQVQGKVRFGSPRTLDEISGNSNFSMSLLDKSAKLDDAILRFSVEQAMQQVTLPLPVDAKGRVILSIDEYYTGQPYCEALNGEISSPNIDIKGLTGWFSIGDMSGTLTCKSGDIAVTVDPENRLGLRADATLAANMQFRVAGNIKPEASLPKEVHDAVKFLGRPDSEGRYPVSL
ncbi:general secretion pathway protein GspN [Pseudoalteromonas rubra]|uniref:Type II secretion system protein N n=1 Tax=Pseudoalteromonas rubra TaxID=43658 RepID=A0A5S3WH77_9GAMM|nr:type II secretion system protein N [Pseudoalteromonas rubra]TMP25297.1 general secretion pathway protein GspN [Pseudoalteromonas rubra]TMP32295.1 general secretion pathway protein GspN [Pseudoalteromonas rubra]